MSSQNPNPAAGESRLVVFDVDGTLTNTNHVDDECFLRSVERTLGVDLGAVEWTDAPHVTDSAIADWLWTTHRGTGPTPAELGRLREAFVASLGDEIARTPTRCLAMPGAVGLFSDIHAAGWVVALATGGWRLSARLKLERAGLLDEAVPMACADDALSRTDIIRLAIERATEENQRSFNRVVSVGDAVWDVAAARELGIPFVGISAGQRAEKLRAAGARRIIGDFCDRSAVLAALNTAVAPRQARD